MQVDIDLDEDAHLFAYAYARGKGISMGAAVSELLRLAEQMPQPPGSASGRLKMSPDGYLVAAKTGKIITPEMVKELSEDDEYKIST